MSSSPLLTLRDLTVGYPDAPLIEGIEAELQAGESLGISGPSGSGKSTLLRTIAGLMESLGGDVCYRGHPVAADGLPRFRADCIYVAQQPALIDGTVGENLRRPFAYRVHRSRMYPEERAYELLVRLGFDAEIVESPARELSVGQQQRVALARALILDPVVLLLDEPTSALDGVWRGEVEALLEERLQEPDRAMVIATHDQTQLKRLATKTLEFGLNPRAAS